MSWALILLGAVAVGTVVLLFANRRSFAANRILIAFAMLVAMNVGGIAWAVNDSRDQARDIQQLVDANRKAAKRDAADAKAQLAQDKYQTCVRGNGLRTLIYQTLSGVVRSAAALQSDAAARNRVQARLSEPLTDLLESRRDCSKLAPPE